MSLLCRPPALAHLCGSILASFLGRSTHLNETRLSVYGHLFFWGASNFDIAHFAQIYKSGHFAHYDYGRESANLAAYHQSSAPYYRFDNIPANYTVILFHGITDSFAPESDVKKLAKKLQHLGLNVVNYRVPAKAWNHLDFLFGTAAGSLVNDPTLAYLDQYTK